MAFWKIHKNPQLGDKLDENNFLTIVEGERKVVDYLRSLPDVGSIQDSKGWSYTNWYTYSKTTYRLNGKYIAMQYKPTEKELEILRPKKKYTPLPKRNIGIKIGDVYHTSWGYDQTNTDWIMVTEISPTGKTVMARRCSARAVENQGSHDRIEPIREAYGDTFRMQVSEYKKNNGEMGYSLTGTYADSRGKKGFRLGSFSKYNIGDTVTETNPMYYH